MFLTVLAMAIAESLDTNHAEDKHVSITFFDSHNDTLEPSPFPIEIANSDAYPNRKAAYVIFRKVARRAHKDVAKFLRFNVIE